MAINIYYLCGIWNHRGHREHRVFLFISVSSVPSVVSIELIPVRSSIFRRPFALSL
jgi:hypothetical protein